MKRTLSAAIAAAGLALGTIATAPAALAITNPADNPHPITVKGDDGNTYTDGEDTLPGYDDIECTYIPGAYFDFDNNRVRYADGQSIPWTEWDRATGYAEWKAKQNQPKPSPTPTSKPGGSTPKPGGSTSGGGTPSSGSGSTPKSGGSTGSGSTGTSDTPVVDDPSTPEDESKAAPKGTTKAGATEAPTDGATSGIDEVTLASGEAAVDLDPTGSSAEDSGGSAAGLLILGGLGVAGLLTYAGYSAFGRKARKGAVS